VLVVLVVLGAAGSALSVFAVRSAAMGNPGGEATSLAGAEGAQGAMAGAAARVGGGGGGGGLGSGGGTRNLVGSALKTCSPPEQNSQTGWTRDGSCAWDPTDGGYHEVRPALFITTLELRVGRADVKCCVVTCLRHAGFPHTTQS
jgi:hypothetical protein